MPDPDFLKIEELLPIPLQERLSGRPSDVWQQTQEWGSDERIFVQAPSGTGKTTLIHMLYGIRNDYKGAVKWGSIVMKDGDHEAQSQLRQAAVSIIFQDLRLFPGLTTLENLEIKRALTNTVSKEEMKSWLQALGIADRAQRPAATLSYGEQQRVAIIRGLLQPFRWLLMDEPFSHLDVTNTMKAAALIGDIVARNKASFILADLDDNNHFPYTKILRL